MAYKEPGCRCPWRIRGSKEPAGSFGAMAPLGAEPSMRCGLFSVAGCPFPPGAHGALGSGDRMVGALVVGVSGGIGCSFIRER